MVQKGDFNCVGENSVQLCTNPCPPFMTHLMMVGCFTTTGGSHVSVGEHGFVLLVPTPDQRAMYSGFTSCSTGLKTDWL